MKKILALFVVTSAALTGCATNDDPYYKIKVVDPSFVMGCKLVGNISSTSQNYGLFNETANDKRLALAKKSAYNLGATHIVLDKPVEDGNTTITEGKAYVCQFAQ